MTKREHLEAAGQACVDWFTDTGDCHFCNPDENEGKHDDDCPLAPLFAEGASGVAPGPVPSESAAPAVPGRLAEAEALLGRWMFWASGVAFKSSEGENLVTATDAFLASQDSVITGHGAGQGPEQAARARAGSGTPFQAGVNPGNQETAVEPGGDSALTSQQAGNGDFAGRAIGTVKGPAGTEDASSAAVNGLRGAAAPDGRMAEARCLLERYDRHLKWWLSRFGMEHPRAAKEAGQLDDARRAFLAAPAAVPVSTEPGASPVSAAPTKGTP